MDIGKGDLIKKGATWGIVKSVDEEFEVVHYFCLTTEDPWRTVVYEKIGQVVYAEPTGQFLNVLSQKEKAVYARYYIKETEKKLSDIENSLYIADATGKDLDNLAKLTSTENSSNGITKVVSVPFKFSLKNGSTISTGTSGSFTDQYEVHVESLRRYTSEEMDSWSKNQELFDPFDDQTPYPLDFDNFIYGDVEECYDEERDYLVIKCVDDFIEHMMTR